MDQSHCFKVSNFKGRTLLPLPPFGYHGFSLSKASLPASNGQPRYWTNRRLAVVFAGLAAFFGTLWIGHRLLFPVPPFSPLKDFQYLNPPPLVHALSIRPSASPNKRAIVSTLYSDSYAIGAAVLGHSIRKANVTARLLLPYLDGRISDEALCTVRTAGWEPIIVPFIPPPHEGKGIYYRFHDQYTKLNIWGLDKMGIEQAVYLDADTLVRRNFDELFDLPFNFAAVPDIYGDRRGFTVNFNAGVLVFRPSTVVLNVMKEKIETATFPLDQAEQSFLNLFFAANVLRLPYAYNANLALKRSSPALWEGMKDEIRIVHYTLTKPFVDEHRGGTPKLLGEQEQRWLIDQAAEQRDGLFADEVGWWREAHDQMVAELGGKMRACRKGERVAR